jgi:hypothetical protein
MRNAGLPHEAPPVRAEFRVVGPVRIELTCLSAGNFKSPAYTWFRHGPVECLEISRK